MLLFKLPGMFRRILLRQIDQLPRPTAASVFILLWDFFGRSGLAETENHLRELEEEPHSLKPYGHPGPCPNHAAKASSELRGLLTDSTQFDLLALRWLKRLDRDLRQEHPRALGSLELPGVEGAPFLLKTRNNWISDHLLQNPRSNPPSVKQGDALSLFPYCSFHMAVPTAPIRGRRIEGRSSQGRRAWATPELHLRMLREWERKHFSVLLWPFTTDITYTGARLTEALPKPGGFNPIRLAEVEQEDDLTAEALEAIGIARQLEATFLILPELSIPPATLTAIQRDLAGTPSSNWPLLILAGTCHRSQSEKDNDLNEAILLGPDGREQHRHRKLTNFIHQRPDGQIGERVDVGHVISVLESPLGNLVPLICLDLFHDTLRNSLNECHGTIFLVPSLSPTTSAHREAARQYWRQRWVSSFVCNRWFATTGKGAKQAHKDQSSFIRLGSERRSEVDHRPSGRREKVTDLTAPRGSSTTVERTERYLYFALR